MCSAAVNRIINNALAEDGVDLDITSESTIDKNKSARFVLKVNQSAALAGVDVFCKVFIKLDSKIKIVNNFQDGDTVKSGDNVIVLSGSAFNILRGERTAINFIAYLSGIATETKKLVELVKGTGVTILDTRKTTPGLRALERMAVKAGGGENHRFNLSDRILIKDNHISESGGVRIAVERAKKYLADSAHRIKGHVQDLQAELSTNTSMQKILVEVEVSNLAELNEAIIAQPDIIMFDNWKVKELKKVIALVPSEIKTEASGMIDPQTVRSYAETGVNYISTSYMVKNAKWIDFSLQSA